MNETQGKRLEFNDEWKGEIEIEIEIRNPRSLKLGMKRDLKRERGRREEKRDRGNKRWKQKEERERENVCVKCLGFHFDLIFLRYLYLYSLRRELWIYYYTLIFFLRECYTLIIS